MGLVLVLAFFSRLDIPEIESVVSSVKKVTCLEERLVLQCGKSCIKTHPSSETRSTDKRQPQSRWSLPGFCAYRVMLFLLDTQCIAESLEGLSCVWGLSIF